VKDKVFICQRCQSRVQKKTPDTNIEYEWTTESFKEFKKESKKLENSKKIVLTTCLGPCPSKRIAFFKLSKGKSSKELSYPAKYSKEKIFKKIFEK
jgi:uncharacterized protein YlaI